MHSELLNRKKIQRVWPLSSYTLMLISHYMQNRFAQHSTFVRQVFCSTMSMYVIWRRSVNDYCVYCIMMTFKGSYRSEGYVIVFLPANKITQTISNRMRTDLKPFYTSPYERSKRDSINLAWSLSRVALTVETIIFKKRRYRNAAETTYETNI